MKKYTGLFMGAILSLTSYTAVAQNIAVAENLLGVAINQDGISFQVSSGGCTGKDSFEFEQRGALPVDLVLKRIEVDMCEAYLPYGTTVEYTWDELGFKKGDHVRIANPLAIVRIVN